MANILRVSHISRFQIKVKYEELVKYLSILHEATVLLLVYR